MNMKPAKLFSPNYSCMEILDPYKIKQLACPYDNGPFQLLLDDKNWKYVFAGRNRVNNLNGNVLARCRV